MIGRSSDASVSGWGAPNDALSSVLLDLRLSGTFFCNSSFAEPWALDIAARDFASFHFVVRGDCWLEPMRKGVRTRPVDLHSGDLVVVPRSPRQLLSSDRQKVGTPLDELPARHLGEFASTLQMG